MTTEDLQRQVQMQQFIERSPSEDYRVAKAAGLGCAGWLAGTAGKILFAFLAIWLFGACCLFPPLFIPVIIGGVLFIAIKMNPPARQQFTPPIELDRVRASVPADVPLVTGHECVVRTTAGEFRAENVWMVALWIREGRVRPDSLVFAPHIGRWRAAFDVEQLRPEFEQNARMPPPQSA